LNAQDPTREPLHGIAINNPHLLNKQELTNLFVARSELLQHLLEDLGSVGEGPGQHHLLIGQRGMGKTTLLRRLRYAVEDDPGLDQHWLPLTFPEEQYNIARLSDLYLNCVDALSDALEERGHHAEARALDEALDQLPQENEAQRTARALGILTGCAERLGRRLILLFDNVELVFERLRDEHGAIRELLSSEPNVLLVGASSEPLEATYKYDAPFYDFFQVHELKGLSLEETSQVLIKLSEVCDTPHVAQLVKDDLARIQTLHVLTGGNPRTVVLLYEVLALGGQADTDNIRNDLERLLDRCTALYKARFEALPVQAQQLVDALAVHWDPITAGDLAAQMRLDVNTVSSQLNRLARQGVVEKVAYYRPESRRPDSKAGFQIAERFFNIWYLMRASRRVRRKLIWLVQFLKLFYRQEELHEQARGHLRYTPARNSEARMRHAEYGLALGQVVDELPLKAALESAAVHYLVSDLQIRRKLAQIIDLDGEDAELKPVVDRHRLMIEAREEVLAAKVNWDGWDPERFWELLGGSSSVSPSEKTKIVKALHRLTEHQVKELLRIFGEEAPKFCDIFRTREAALKLMQAIREGYMIDVMDIEGAQAAAQVLDEPEILVLAMASRLERNGEIIHDLKAILQGSRVPFAWQRWADKAVDAGYPPDEVEAAYCRAIDLDPEYALPWNGFGNLLKNHLSRYEEAEQAYRKAIEIDPKYAYPWNGLGSLLSDHLSRYEEAEQAYRKAIEIDPKYAYPWNSLAWFLYQTGGRDEEAEGAGRRAIELDPQDLYAVHTLAEILMHRGNSTEAFALARRFISGGEPEFHEENWSDIVTFFREAVGVGRAGESVELLDELEMGERWRPLREALAAAPAGTRDYLRRVAPEVRHPAEQILDQIMPESER